MVLLVRYKTAGLTPTEQVKFYYAFKGRNNNPGIVARYNITLLSKGVFLIPDHFEQEIIQFFHMWKIPIEIYTIIIKEQKTLSFQEETNEEEQEIP